MESNQINNLTIETALNNLLTLASNGNRSYVANVLLALIADQKEPCDIAPFKKFVDSCNELGIQIELDGSTRYPNWIFDAISMHASLITAQAAQEPDFQLERYDL